MADLTSLKNKLASKQKQLADYEAQRDFIILGGQSYSFQNGDDRRNVENVSLASLNALITKLEYEIDALENQIARGGKSGKVAIIGVST